ncbi:hypothetical protein PUN28_012920 [Cardiocondyla obscurior]|uniref:Uncharacterized protein n=1 Tax=Cardiocondyla obscurior TaxID=286306 RepID=A0AAW2FBN0_9HYME
MSVSSPGTSRRIFFLGNIPGKFGRAFSMTRDSQLKAARGYVIGRETCASLRCRRKRRVGTPGLSQCFSFVRIVMRLSVYPREARNAVRFFRNFLQSPRLCTQYIKIAYVR